jgi:hypothetical protein
MSPAAGGLPVAALTRHRSGPLGHSPAISWCQMVMATLPRTCPDASCRIASGTCSSG